MEAHLEYKYKPGEAAAEEISYLVYHALKGHREHTEDLWRALSKDTSDCYDEGRWLRSIAHIVVGNLLEGNAISSEERGRAALKALGLDESADHRWRLKQDILAIFDFDDLMEIAPVRTPTQIARAMMRRGHFAGKNIRNATKVVTRILRDAQK